MKDPVCLMDIDLREAGAMSIHQGRAYYFCGTNCQQHFTQEPESYIDNAQAERISIGIMGSADTEENEEINQALRLLGQTIAEKNLILISGACPGLPYECAIGARERGGLSVGISPALSLDEHIHKYDSPADAYDVIIYTGSGLMGREVTNIRSSDMVLIAGGRSGTLGEFSIAYDEGKLIGVLQGTGGIADTLPEIVKNIEKDTGASLIYESDPVRLVEKLLEIYEQRHYRHPSCFCEPAVV
jgi:uncharacterized protein (TIGR00725 family)